MAGGRTAGRVDGLMDERQMDGQTDGWMDGRRPDFSSGMCQRRSANRAQQGIENGPAAAEGGVIGSVGAMLPIAAHIEQQHATANADGPRLLPSQTFRQAIFF